MTCNRIRWLLSIAPRAGEEPLDPSVRHHLDQCPTCRAFQQALRWVEADLHARPLARPTGALLPAVMGDIERYARPEEITPPFTRAFCLISAMVALCALGAGALLLQIGPVTALQGSESFLANTWLNPVWARDASVWLSTQNRQAAQFILAALAGIVVTISGAVIGFRASHGH